MPASPEKCGDVVEERAHVGSLSIDPLTMQEVVRRIRGMALAKGEKARTIATANAQFAQIARIDRRFRTVLQQAEIVVADGMSIVAASRLLGRPLPERIAGVDLVVELCREAAYTQLSVYFLGGRPCAAKKAADNLRARFALLNVAGTDCPPFGFENDPAESAAVARRISEAAPDILFVGLGAPKQEFWMERHRDDLLAKVMVGVGGSFEILSGMKARAPQWMQKAGLEWAFRLGLEPRRLWMRYLFGNLTFIKLIVRQRLWDRQP
jgi:N-acetylglucosaminyldiphosphoundecaprenol N-acetyl-beta-D-mannosaminyltransferase